MAITSRQRYHASVRDRAAPGVKACGYQPSARSGARANRSRESACGQDRQERHGHRDSERSRETVRLTGAVVAGLRKVAFAVDARCSCEDIAGGGNPVVTDLNRCTCRSPALPAQAGIGVHQYADLSWSTNLRLPGTPYWLIDPKMPQIGVRRYPHLLAPVVTDMAGGERLQMEHRRNGPALSPDVGARRAVCRL